MPSLRGVTVRVTDVKGDELPELGLQRLREGTGKDEKVSAYIQSITGSQFRVSIQPRIPFVHVNHPESGSESDEVDDYESDDTESDESDNPRKDSGVPEYAFVASLFLDGRMQPERRLIIHLNPADKDFTRPDGKVSFKHRWVQSRDGTIMEHSWVFKENAIETVFDKLMIQGRNDGNDEDTVIEAMHSSGLGFEHDSGTEKSKVGQIVVELKRVTLGRKKKDRSYRSRHQEGQDEDIDMTGATSDITHATGFTYDSTITSPISIVDYWDYKPEEGKWATFQFFYRSAEQLQKFGFPGYGKKCKSAKKALSDKMANLTPLSIAQPLTRARKKTQEDLETFEEKVKREGFKVEDGKHKLDFDFESKYRDASADDEMEAEERDKYSAAPLPFLVPKAPQAVPQRDGAILGLPDIDPPLASRVASTLIAAKTIEDLEQSKDNALGEDNEGVPHVEKEPSSRLSPRPDSCEVSKLLAARQLSSATPISLDRHQTSSPPQPSHLTRDNIAKLALSSGHGPRISLSSQARNNDADDEAADDELNTESDLETHADDEDNDYSANPEEDEESQHLLRSQLTNVTIKKRAHAELEDAREESQGSEKYGGAAQVDARHDGDIGKVQMSLFLPMTEQEESDGHCGKKARTVNAQGFRGDPSLAVSSPIGEVDGPSEEVTGQ